jgi:membrane fusion protein (multidrug efflux system)
MPINNRAKQIAAGGFLIGLLILGGCGQPTTPGGPPKGGAPEVAVVVIKEEQMAITTELPGRTSPYLLAEVRPQVNGLIQKRLFLEGGDIKAGDLLYQIDPAPYQASYENARAALARSEANLPAIRARVNRYKELVEIKAVSHQEYDDATASLKQVEAEVEVNKAVVETARINLANTRITAPISGRIGKSNVTVGALSTAYQGSAFTTIQQMDPIYVDATQSSAVFLRLKRNIEAGRIKGDGPGRAKVKLFLEDGTPYPLEGALKFSDITVDPTTGSFILRMVFPNPRHTLLPGMYVRTLVQEGVVSHALLAPQQGISRDPKGNPVALIVDDSGKVQQRMLTVDRAIGDKWLVSSGLKTGDRLIVEGLQRVRPGTSVKVIPFDPARKDGPGAAKTHQSPAKAN